MRKVMSKRALHIAIYVAAVMSFAADASARVERSADFTVEINANFAGCATPEVLGWSAKGEIISAEIILKPRAVQDPTSLETPCVCRGGRYYFSVYPRHESAKYDTVWTQGPSELRIPLAVGPFQMRKTKRYHQTISFSSKLLNGQRSKFYYLVLGCH